MTEVSKPRLDGWKAIAAYLKCDERTALRWRAAGLPVHRMPGKTRGRVIAYSSELDAWLASRPACGPLESGVELLDSGIGLAAIEHGAVRNSPPSSRTAAGSPLKLIRRFRKEWKWIAMGTVVAGCALFAATRLTHSYAVGLHPRVTQYVQLSSDGLMKQSNSIRLGGSFLYFNETIGGQKVVSAMSIEGGPVRELPIPFPNAELQDVDSNGRKLLVTPKTGVEAEAPLWITNVDGNPPRRVGGIFCHAAIWAPDGQRIAFARDSSIFTARDDGSDVREVARLNGVVRSLRWSRSGSRLRFVVFDAQISSASAWEVTVAERNGRPIRVPELGSIENCCKSIGWTGGDNGFIVGAAEAWEKDELWVFPEAPASKQASPNRLLLPSGSAAISGFVQGDDANTIFALGANKPRGELVRFDPRTRQFENYLPGLSAFNLSFSSDEQWVAYVDFANRSLWRSRVDGSEMQRLTSGEYSDIGIPRWSPDGRRIAFASQVPSRPWRIYIIARDGGIAREASTGDDNQGAPTWSPDGRKLAYGNVHCQELHSCAVHVVDVTSGEVSTLPNSDGLRTARWSPDGRYIAALQPEHHELMLYEAREQKWITLAHSVTGDDINWSRDSQFVYVDSPQAERPIVTRVRIRDGAARNVVSLDSFEKMAGQFIMWFGLAPDNSPIFFRRLDASEVYRLRWVWE